MAKKSAVKINRSAAIKAYRAEHPKAKPAEVAAAVSKQLGVDIKPQYVSVVSLNAKKKAGNKTKGQRVGRGRANLNGYVVGKGFAATMKAAAEFIAAAGGIDNAIEALDSIALMPNTRGNG